MTTLSADTNPKVEKIQIELLRKASSARKLQMVTQMNNTVRAFMFAELKQRNPNASSEMLRRKFAELLLGDELARKVYEYRKALNAAK